jgi:glycosyltransferase involved in cell wall biosynthesis
MTAALPHVAILMATYNGAEFLPQQLDSLAAQTHENWRLWVSDDGSADATLDILRRYQEAWGQDKLRLLAGPGRGFQANFLSLTARPDISADYFAWSDQDDVWLPEKLARALERLDPLGFERPALYCGRTIYIDRQGREIGRSALMNHRPPSFANALMQCICGANTMVFNPATRSLIAVRPDLAVATHDGWTYQLVCGCGGLVLYDPEPMVRYRQHGLNIIGQNRSLAARWSRVKRLFSGDLKRYIEINLEALYQAASRLTPENRLCLENLVELRRPRSPFQRLRLFRKGGFCRQSRLEQAAIYMAVLLNRV